METVTKSDIAEILKQLAILKKDVEDMKARITDDDCILTEDDCNAIKEYEKEKKEGKLVCLDQVKKSLKYAKC